MPHKALGSGLERQSRLELRPQAQARQSLLPQILISGSSCHAPLNSSCFGHLPGRVSSSSDCTMVSDSQAGTDSFQPCNLPQGLGQANSSKSCAKIIGNLSRKMRPELVFCWYSPVWAHRHMCSLPPINVMFQPLCSRFWQEVNPKALVSPRRRMHSPCVPDSLTLHQI